MLLEHSHMYGSHVNNIHISAQFPSFNSCYPLYFHLFHKHYNTSAKSNKYLQSLAIQILIACHHLWHIQIHELQPIMKVSCDLHFASDLPVITRYYPGLSLAQWYHSPLLNGWTFHNHSPHRWRGESWSSRQLVMSSNPLLLISCWK
jgi:hypothetical protein